MAEAYIVATARTAGGRKGGRLSGWHPADLAAAVLDSLVQRTGADPAQMYHSLNHTLRNLDDDTVVYPGHAYSAEATSTIGNEKRHNMFMRFRSLEEFLSAMGYSR